MFKKFICLLLIVLAVFPFYSCSKQEIKDSTEESKPFEPTDEYIELISLKGLTLTNITNYFDRLEIKYSVNGDFGEVESISYDGGTKNGKTYIKKGSTVVINLSGKHEAGEKVIYLTFDDGPNANTNNILNILQKYNATATFFVYGNRVKGYATLLKTLVNQGSLIGCHSYTHDLDRTSNGFIYQSTSTFISELNKFSADMEYVFGSSYQNMPKIMRFPGGSSTNGRLTLSESKVFIDEVRKNGYKVYDWTCLTNDADSREQLEGESNTDYFMRILKSSMAQNDGSEPYILLMHEKQITVDALDTILSYLVSLGFTFDVLSNCEEYTFSGH